MSVTYQKCEECIGAVCIFCQFNKIVIDHVEESNKEEQKR